jgi:hypothetical protein
MTLALSLQLSTSDDAIEVAYPAMDRWMLQEDGASFVLQEDGTSKIIFSLSTD